MPRGLARRVAVADHGSAARGAPSAGGAGPEGLLGTRVSRRAQGNERPLSAPAVARRAVVGHRHAPRQAARHLTSCRAAWRGAWRWPTTDRRATDGADSG